MIGSANMKKEGKDVQKLEDEDATHSIGNKKEFWILFILLASDVNGRKAGKTILNICITGAFHLYYCQCQLSETNQ